MTEASAPRYYCDEMLQGVGRWLRAAGHDTAIACGGIDDNALISRTLIERRLLLTCDRELAKRKIVHKQTVILTAAGLDETARALTAEIGVDWLYAPFTRCLVDNAPLRPAGEAARGDLPPKARHLGGPIQTCPNCRRLYWPGSHVRRMLARLETWHAPERNGRLPATVGGREAAMKFAASRRPAKIDYAG